MDAGVVLLHGKVRTNGPVSKNGFSSTTTPETASPINLFVFGFGMDEAKITREREQD